jgi:hypothetical protein
MGLATRLSVLMAGLVALFAFGHATAADAVRGKALFSNTNGAPLSCAAAACHSGFPSVVRNSVNKGSNPTVILNAISSDKGGMRVLAPYVNTTDANDIAAYIANPAAGDGAPAASLSVASLTFAAQTLGTTSAAQTITLSNSGTAVLNISGIAFSGMAAAEFARSGTCQIGSTVAAGGSCTLQATFKPTTAGTRTASLTVSHNAGSGTAVVALSGTGALAPAVASVTPTSLSFTQTLDTTSNAQSATVRNTGGQALTLSTIAISGANAAEFALAGASTCASGAVLSGGASCTVAVTFRPTAAGARTASLSVAHNAAGSPLTVALSGTGSVLAQPAISLSATSLDFGTLSVGQKTSAQTLTLTNSGQAPLTLAGLSMSGPQANEFALAGTCISATTVAPGDTCVVQITFAPSAIGSRMATLTVTSNAANGNPVVALAGTGVHFEITTDPNQLALQSTVGTMSAPVEARITDSGASPITVSSITVIGPFVMQQGSNSCGAGPIDLVSGQSCSVHVAFMPATAGPATGEVVIESGALAAPVRIALTAQATAQDVATPAGSSPPPSASAGASAAMAPTNAGGGGCTVGPTGELIDPTLAGMLAVSTFVLLRRRMARRQVGAADSADR